MGAGAYGPPAMRVAFLGSRGVPARYSGVETFVEQLGVRLVDHGHEVTVYSRRHHSEDAVRSHRGMRVVQVPGIATKHLDTITHTLVSCVHALFRRQDIVVMCISGNSPLAFIPRLRGAKVVLNVDGSDWRRKKWGRIARTYIRLSEWLSTRLPNATVTDSRVMHNYYLERFGLDTECILYGADVPPPEQTGALERLGVAPQGYLLLVGRLVRENCIHHLVDAFERLDTDLRCVIVGDAPYEKPYIADLKRRGPHVLFTGYLFGDSYRELMQNAFAVVLCTEVGGTHPVLVEAMASGNCVVVNDTAANLEVIGEAGLSYRGADGSAGLLRVLASLVGDESRVERYRGLARARVQTAYSWEVVTAEYERLFARLLGTHERAEAAVLTTGNKHG